MISSRQNDVHGGVAVLAPKRGGKRSMRCPYVEMSTESLCRAAQMAYRPGGFELEEYCLGERHRLCPFFCKHQIGEDAGLFAGSDDTTEGPEVTGRKEGSR